MNLQEFKDATKLLLEKEAIKKQRDNLRAILRELYDEAQPTFLEDADTGVRLPPRWNERLKDILKDENQEGKA